MRIPNPYETILFDRTDEELEYFLLFCIVVAGKKASTQIKLLQQFLNYASVENSTSPFDIIRRMDAAGQLSFCLRALKLGQYTRLVSCFREVVSSGIDLRTCTIEELEAIHGIGPKTSRFFITCNRPNVRHAVIDTHLLKFLNQYLGMTVPATTPSGREYARLEKAYLDYSDKVGCNPAELDLAIWKIYGSRDDSEFKRLTNSSKVLAAV